jgi:hypothetical protein
LGGDVGAAECLDQQVGQPIGTVGFGQALVVRKLRPTVLVVLTLATRPFAFVPLPALPGACAAASA